VPDVVAIVVVVN